MNKKRGAHLRCKEEIFKLHMTYLELEWRSCAMVKLPHLNPKLSFDQLHKFLIHNIQKTKHVSIPNGTNLMLAKDFKIYYKKSQQN